MPDVLNLSVSADIPAGVLDGPTLASEIFSQAGLPPAKELQFLQRPTQGTNDPDLFTLQFAGNLSSPEEAAVMAVVAAHTGALEEVVPGSGNPASLPVGASADLVTTAVVQLDAGPWDLDAYAEIQALLGTSNGLLQVVLDDGVTPVVVAESNVSNGSDWTAVSLRPRFLAPAKFTGDIILRATNTGNQNVEVRRSVLRLELAP